MRAQVKRWGNSAAVRLPAALLAESGLRENQTIDLRVEAGRVVIEPVIEDAAFLGAVAGTLSEWTSAEDEAAWADL